MDLFSVLAMIVGLLVMLLGGFLVKLFYFAFRRKYLDFVNNKDRTSLPIIVVSQLFITGGVFTAIGFFLIGLLIVILFTIDIVRSLIG
jgi:hypothetical protein